MAEDEASIQASLDEYNAQLSQIRQLLKSSDDLTKLELYDLEKDLMELIKIAEESMLSVKKQNLLALYSASASSTDPYQTGTSNHEENDMPSETEDTVDDQSDLVGAKCRVKYTHEWGGFQYHNAIVLNCDIYDDDDNDEPRVKVHVLFLNPVHTSMVPCKYFLNGHCDYETTCRYSHGYVVDMEELEEYVEPDFTCLQKRCKCLAKYEKDGVWYPATVEDVLDEQVTVSFDQFDDELHTLDFHSILPLLSNTDDSSDEEDDLDQDVDGLSESRVTRTSMCGPMCDWEKYTKGIGSKLLQKMGYILGTGLGKGGRGITEPIEIKLLPPGKSLDHIAELREKGKIKDPTKAKGKQKANSSETVKETAFDVINKLLDAPKGQKCNDSESSSKHSVEDSYKSIKKHLKTKGCGDVRKTKNNKDSKINLEMFKTGEELSTLKKQLHMQKQALSRNGGDTSVSRRIKQNIAETESKISEVEQKNKSLQTKLHMKNQSKKLTVF